MKPITAEDIRQIARAARRAGISRDAALHHARQVVRHHARQAARHHAPRQVGKAGVGRMIAEEWPAEPR